MESGLIDTIYYDNECEKEFGDDINTAELAQELLDAAAEILGCDYECECNLLITTSESIHNMNLETRGIDRPTDVLSFPIVDFKTPCDYGCIDENDFSVFNPDTGMLMLGDIVICRDKVFSQAEEYGHTVRRELAFLIVHSILHLFGYDHIDDNQRRDMEEMQKTILNKLNITKNPRGINL